MGSMWLNMDCEVRIMDGFKQIHEIIDYVSIQRSKSLEEKILCEIFKIIEENQTLTLVKLNEKAIVHALLNAIPSKPHLPWDSMTKVYSCPACIMSVDESDKYCSNCGKKLDWSDEDE